MLQHLSPIAREELPDIDVPVRVGVSSLDRLGILRHPDKIRIPGSPDRPGIPRPPDDRFKMLPIPVDEIDYSDDPIDEPGGLDRSPEDRFELPGGPELPPKDRFGFPGGPELSPSDIRYNPFPFIGDVVGSPMTESVVEGGQERGVSEYMTPQDIATERLFDPRGAAQAIGARRVHRRIEDVQRGVIGLR